MRDVPKVPFGDLLESSQNGLSKRRGDGEPVRVLRLADIVNGQVDESDPREINLSSKEIEKYQLQRGDLVCVRVNGSPSLVGRLVPFQSATRWAYCDHFIRFRPKGDVVDARYLNHYFSTQLVRRHVELNMVSSAGQNTVSQGTMLGIPVPLPTLDEQRRIVAEIDKQFSRLDEAVANLQRVKANLKRYKAAVLKAAVEGRLVETEASIARREGRGYETGEQLLRCVLVDRKTSWAGKGKYVEPAMPDLGSLPALPEGWIWATAEAVCDPVVDCHNKTAPYVNSGIPLVRTTNIRDGQLLMDGMRFVDQPTYEFWSRRCPPAPGDVLFTREAPMGEACIVPAGMTVCLGQRTMLMRPSPAITASFLLAALMSPVIADLIDRVAVGSGVKHLRVGDVERLPIPLAPKAEQLRIVTELDRLLSVQQTVEAEVDANLRRAATLRAAVLSRSFQSTH